MKRYLLLICLAITLFMIWPNIGQTHGPGPWMPPSRAPDPLSGGGQTGTPPPPLSSEGITYDYLGGLISQIVKEEAVTDTTITVKLMDPSKIGIELLNIYFTPFDPYQLTSVSGMNLPQPKKEDLFTPEPNLYLRQHLTLAVLQAMVNLETCPEAPVAEYLIEIGQPSRLAAQMAPNVSPAIMGANWFKDKNIGKRISADVLPAVGEPAPQPPPEAVKGASIYETMINRTIVEELSKDYYFPGIIYFGRCLRELDVDSLPFIISTAKNSTHSLTKRNAVSLLCTYNTPQSVQAVRELFADNINKDKVIRNRALSSLVNKKDGKIVPLLIETLKTSEDKYFKTMVAYCLGIMGAKQAIQPLMEYLETDPNDRDVLWSVIASLGMLCDKSNEDVKARVQKLVDKKLSITKTFALVALYGMGEESAADQLALRPSDNPFRKIEFPALYFAIRVLGKLNANETLLGIVNNRGNDPRMRLAAMVQMKFTDKHVDMLRELIAQVKTPPIVKAYALYVLFSLRDKNINTEAEAVVKDSLTALTRKGMKFEGEGFDTVIGLRILGLMNANKESLIKEVIDKALEGLKTEMMRDNPGILLPKPPVVETALAELGKIKTKESVRILVELAKQKDHRFRGEAMLALGNMPPEKGMIKSLIDLLSDWDGWNRYCAYVAVKKLTGQDFACEWIYDSEATRKATAAQWKKWWDEEGSKKY